jgi:hypothetical protein
MVQQQSVSLRRRRHYLGSLLELARIGAPDERRSAWRQAMATLAAAAIGQDPVPLEGYPPEQLLTGVQVALADGLVDDLGFLETAHAAVAVYELAAALPPCPEKRELGRRIARWLQEGDAQTFVALATSLALGSRRGLTGPGVRARVALALDLPIGTGVRADGLALALVSRRDTVREWLLLPAQGALPSRRLAARLLERAAREAARRAAQGDDAAARIFETEQIAGAWTRLLSDREPLVWKHVATARGLLSDAVPRFADQMNRELRPDLSPTEWRRAVCSLTARIAVAPADAERLARDVLDGDLPLRDQGLRAAFIFGLARAAEAEPATADALLEPLVRGGGLDAIEALVDFRRERVGDEIGAWAVERARALLRELATAPNEQDDGRRALVAALLDELAPESERGVLTLRERVDEARLAFVSGGARDAYAAAVSVTEAARRTMDLLEAANLETREGRERAFRLLRELDVALLESSTLSDLLALGARGVEGTPSQLSDLWGRLHAWLLRAEAPAVSGPVPHLTMRLRRLRTFLHVLDADAGDDDAAQRRAATATTTLLARARDDRAIPLRRTLLATIARACDALIRAELVETSDVLAGLLVDVPRPEDLAIVAEATMVSDLENVLKAYLALDRVLSSGADFSRVIDATLEMARALPIASSSRVEALRAALLRLGHAAEDMGRCFGLDEVTRDDEFGALQRLEAAVLALVQVLRGGRRRLGRPADDDAPVTPVAIGRVAQAAERAATHGDREELLGAVDAARSALEQELPRALAMAAARALERVAALPGRAPTTTAHVARTSRSLEPRLPAWLPPARILGGFYVVRPLGRGAGGTVFVVKRADDRHDTGAPCFALKVPEYDGAAARTLSESEFLRTFREEAGALLALPPHPNLASLVTFDAGARPKPILVMELIEGPSLERVIAQGGVRNARQAIGIVDGIAAGLEAMHAAGLGHLDVKPSNVILRDAGRGAPVLVDFGLAGRRIRPGCGTASYGAPEIWGLIPTGWESVPAHADVYALACVAYEVFTGRPLFGGSSEVATITAHLAHDGGPETLAELAKHGPAPRRFASLLAEALRRDPRARIDAAAFRAGLAEVSSLLDETRWPLAGS